MARHEANADFQRLLQATKAIAWLRSVRNDDEVGIIGFPHKINCTGGLVRSENNARTLYTVEKRLFLQSKSAHFEKFRRRAMRGKITFLFLAALRAAQHGLYTSNLFPTPMNNSYVVHNYHKLNITK